MDNDLMAIDNSYIIGDGEGFDKQALKAYKYEKELKKVIKEKESYIEAYIHGRYDIPLNIKVKVTEPKEAPQYEEFSICELINSKLTSLNSSLTKSIYDIYIEKGIIEAVVNLHNISNLEIV